MILYGITPVEKRWGVVEKDPAYQARPGHLLAHTYPLNGANRMIWMLLQCSLCFALELVCQNYVVYILWCYYIHVGQPLAMDG